LPGIAVSTHTAAASPRVVLWVAATGSHAEHLNEGWDTTDIVRAEEGYPKTSIALASADGDAISAVALFTKGTRVATATNRVRLSNIEAIAEPIDFDELRDELPPPPRRHLRQGLLPPRTGEECLAAVGRLRPELLGTLGYLGSLLAGRRLDAPEAALERLTLEKEATGLALSIAGIDRRPLTTFSPSDDSDSFLAGLGEYRVSEDNAIVHDWLKLPGFGLLGTGATGAAEFSDGKRRVSILNVNRDPPERSLGVDLIYIHHDLDAFVMVQYKRMREESGDPPKLVYRPSGDRSFPDELARMHRVATAPAGAGVPDSYRLHPGACYIKLCHPTTLELTSADLVKGFYLPLDYWEVLAESTQTRGPQGGLSFSYESVSRYLTNTLFIELASEAWIGSRGAASHDIAAVVQAGVQAGRSVIVAMGTAESVRG
jgi:hypothetical protein